MALLKLVESQCVMVAGQQSQNESLEERTRRLFHEEISLVSYDSDWPRLFKEEKEHLLKCLPNELIKRIEHYGSTAVPGLWAKPIIDMFVEVTSLEKTKEKIVPILVSQGYEYLWLPFKGQDFYALLIKRDTKGQRMYHIHFVETGIEQCDELVFRDYLIEHPPTAAEYQALKLQLVKKYPNDRQTYTDAKTDFIAAVVAEAKRYFKKR